MYETFLRLHKEGLTVLLAEQSVDLALEVASHAYVLQVGRSVLPAPPGTSSTTPTCSASTWAWGEADIRCSDSRSARKFFNSSPIVAISQQRQLCCELMHWLRPRAG